MARQWTCRSCRVQHPRIKQKCECGTKRPPARKPKHQAVLEVPYEVWVEAFGEQCGVCGRPPGPTRRLDRDHDHRTGEPRGLLCHACNRGLPSHINAKWLRAAADYLERDRPDLAA